MTFREVDSFFNKAKDTAKYIFMLHRGELREGEDFIFVTRRDYADRFSPNEKLWGNPKAKMVLLFESGLSKLMGYLDEIKDIDPITETKPNDTGSETTDITALGLFERDNKVLVSSRDVARVFEKEHRRVLQDIRDLDVSSVFQQHNFVQSYYVNEQNKQQPEYLMTRDGFTILAMGYTGKKAMQFKEAYINAFNKMEGRLREADSYEIVEIKDTIELTPIERMKIGEIISKCPKYNMPALLDVYKPYLSDETLRAYKVNIERTEITSLDSESLRVELIQYAKKQKLSQRNLAKLLGVSQTTVCDWFCNKSSPRKPDVVYRICELLQIARL